MGQSESPRYLLVEGRITEAQHVLLRMARENAVKLELGPLKPELRATRTAGIIAPLIGAYLLDTSLITALTVFAPFFMLGDSFLPFGPR